MLPVKGRLMKPHRRATLTRGTEESTGSADSGTRDPIFDENLVSENQAMKLTVAENIDSATSDSHSNLDVQHQFHDALQGQT